MPRAIDSLLGQYRENHANPTNELIHCVCVPAIMFALLGLLWSIHPLLTLATSAAALYYYYKLSKPFAVGMLLMALAMLGLLLLSPPEIVLPLSLGIFVLAWIGQFIGHKIEGKKPSFFDDMRFLLVGPLFVLSFLYQRLKVSY